MTSESHRTRETATASPNVLPIIVVLIGVVQLAALLAYGLLLNPPQYLPFGMLATVPLFLLMFVTMTATSGRRAPAVLYVLPPVAAGLVIVTLLVGTYAFPDSAAWWLIGALASAIPLILLSREYSRWQADTGPLSGRAPAQPTTGNAAQTHPGAGARPASLGKDPGRRGYRRH